MKNSSIQGVFTAFSSFLEEKAGKTPCIIEFWTIGSNIFCKFMSHEYKTKCSQQPIIANMFAIIGCCEHFVITDNPIKRATGYNKFFLRSPEIRYKRFSLYMYHGKLDKITVKMSSHSSIYLQPSPRYSVKLENEKLYF